MDNPVNSKIALDLGEWANQDDRRTGERNANRDRIRVCEEPPGTARRTAAVHEAPADPVHGIDYHPVITDWLAGLPGTSGDGGIAGEGAGRFAGWPTRQQGS